jgi:two-component system CheB/CheR fusion protein
VILTGELRVWEANRAFYERFHLEAETTEGRLLYDLGDRQWDIPRLRNLLEEVIPNNTAVDGFEVEHDFRELGRLHMVLHARRLIGSDGRPDLILLAVEESE